MKNSTPQPAESCVWVENPALTTNCPICGASVKHSLDDADSPVFLSFPYRIRTIKIFAGGRSFEKVDRSYLHDCAEAVPPKPDQFRGAALAELALL